MNWRTIILRSVIVTTIVSVATSAVVGLYFPSSRAWGRYLGAIALSAIGLLYVVSLLNFSSNRRTAIIGLVVALSALIIGYLLPEL
jgi:hypothetical protein